ncbi:MAG: class I SAM-dependent methyltransferase [Thermodesulfobacteriota bacterium]
MNEVGTGSGSSKWQTKELARTFLEGVRGAIPGADLQLAVIGNITRDWSPTAGSILDLGCGNGILGRYLMDLLPSARGVFADFSEPMLAAARENLAGRQQAFVVAADFATSRWLDAVSPFAPYDIIVSGFAIHHQPDGRKQELYAEIFSLLAPGGVFLNLEHVASASVAGQRLFDAFFLDHLLAFHTAADPAADRQAIADAYYNRPDKEENILAPVAVQCRWLEEIGFDDVDCFFKVFELALFGGRRRPGNEAAAAMPPPA